MHTCSILYAILLLCSEAHLHHENKNRQTNTILLDIHFYPLMNLVLLYKTTNKNRIIDWSELLSLSTPLLVLLKETSTQFKHHSGDYHSISVYGLKLWNSLPFQTFPFIVHRSGCVFRRCFH